MECQYELEEQKDGYIMEVREAVGKTLKSRKEHRNGSVRSV